MYHKVGMGLAQFVLIGTLTVALVGCTMGQGVTVPERAVVIDTQTALDAQNMAMGGMMMGSVTLDESQFSSLLTELLKANTGENNPVESVTAWFEAETIYLQVDVKDGVLPASVGNTLAVAGGVTVDNGKLMLDLTEASAGTYKVEGAALAPINAQINAALANLNFGVPVQVETAEGALTISLTQ